MNTRANTRRAQYVTGHTKESTRVLKSRQNPSVEVNDITRIPAGVVDIDSDNKCEECGPYTRNLYKYLNFLESKQQTRRGKAALTDCKVEAKWRTILVDWMREISIRLRTTNESFYLAVAFLDRFFDRSEAIQKHDVQMAGITALFIAAKYEEIYPPSIEDLADLSDGTYSVKQILAYELHMFNVLDFDLSQPYALQFLRRIASSRKDNLSTEVYTGAKYLIELSVLDVECIGVPVSAIAAAALKVSCNVFGVKWDKNLAYYSDYSSKELSGVEAQLCRLARKAAQTAENRPYGKQRKRYSTEKNECVAKKFQ